MAKTEFEPREGWWFSDASGVLPHGDGRPIVIGEKLSVKGKLVLCRNALHGSYHPFDALKYAPGPILHKVLFEGERIEDDDKVGSRSRTILASVDATEMLRYFARRQALSVASNWAMPDIVRRYLETGDETLRSAAESAAYRAAESAAYREANSAAYSAIYSAARSAARSAAESAAWNAAQNAVNDAVWIAANDAANSAAWSAAKGLFNEMVVELFSAKGVFNEMVAELFSAKEC